MRSKRKGILFFVDNDPQGYKLLCCGSFGLDFYSFIQITFGSAVLGDIQKLGVGQEGVRVD